MGKKTLFFLTVCLLSSFAALNARDGLKRVWSEQGNLKIKSIYNSNGTLLKQQAWNKITGAPANLPTSTGMSSQISQLQSQNEILKHQLILLNERLDNMEMGVVKNQEDTVSFVTEKVQNIENKLEEKSTPKFKLGGEAYMRYEYKLKDKDNDANKFELDLMYINFIFNTGKNSYVRYTPQLGGRAGGSYVDAHTKYAYFNVSQAFGDKTWVRGGMVHNPLFYHLWKLSGDGKASGYRYQMGTFAENNMGLSSADLGLAFGGKFNNKSGDWYAMLSNGEGYTAPEVGKSKDAHLRVHFTPSVGRDSARNLHLTLYGLTGEYEKSQLTTSENDKTRFFAQLAWKEDHRWMLAAEYLTTEDPTDMRSAKYPSLTSRAGLKSTGEGYSFFSTLNFSLFNRSSKASKWEILLRADQFDPDNKIANNDSELYTYGISYRWSPNYQTLLSIHNDEYDSGSGLTDNSRILLSTHVVY